jgi:hypothetical protein
VITYLNQLDTDVEVILGQIGVRKTFDRDKGRATDVTKSSR